jgi:hypothetical protein
VIDAVYRAESRRVLATLIRLLGGFELAEEAPHEAFAAAVERHNDSRVKSGETKGVSGSCVRQPLVVHDCGGPQPPKSTRLTFVVEVV